MFKAYEMSEKTKMFLFSRVPCFQHMKLCTVRMVHLLPFKIQLWIPEVKSNVNAPLQFKIETNANTQRLAVDLAHTFHGASCGCWQQGTPLTRLCTVSLKTPAGIAGCGGVGLPARAAGSSSAHTRHRNSAANPVVCKQVFIPRSRCPGWVGSQWTPRTAFSPCTASIHLLTYSPVSLVSCS